MASRQVRAAGRTAPTIRVLIAHPHPGERSVIRTVLDTGEQIRVVALTGDAGEAVTLADRMRPTVTLLDDRITAPEGTDLVRALARRSPVIALTAATEHRAISTMLRAPFKGCLVYGHHEPADLLGAVRAVAAGLGWLSPVAVAAVAWALRESTRPPVP
ncbi:response regulator [Micromonospora craniellae]|nr:response regulator [Micromonospora craniellae]QOC91578.1 response regulator transcription factor [Micromonospora craniellae]